MEQIMSYAGRVMFAPVYTRSVYKPYPAAPEDACRALLRVRGHCGEYGCRQDPIFVMGDSTALTRWGPRNPSVNAATKTRV